MIRPGPATLVLGLGTLITHGFGLSLLPAMLPRIADDFAVGYGVLGSVAAAGLVAYSTGALAAGRLVDRFPSRELLIGTYVLSGTGLVAAALSPSPAVLTVAAVILGFVAPVSWAVTLHIAGVAVELEARSLVMAGASSGAALGVLVNGVLIQTSSTLHSWQVSFLIAAALAAIPIAGSLVLLRATVPPPQPHGAATPRAGFRRVAAARAGRLAVLAAVTAGVAGFTFSVFLTATAIDEMLLSSWSVAILWFLIGGIGTIAGPVLGRLGDRATPLSALAVGSIAYAVGLIVLLATWNYVGLMFAAFGYTLMNGPLWGLVGALANRWFDAATAVRAISLGLIGAALGGAISNAAAGAWIDATSSFRVPVAAMAAIMTAMSVWYLAIARSGGLEATSGGSVPLDLRPARSASDR